MRVPFLIGLDGFVNPNDGDNEDQEEEGEHHKPSEWPCFSVKQFQSEHGVL
jgi:hypothetical protein